MIAETSFLAERKRAMRTRIFRDHGPGGWRRPPVGGLDAILVGI
jgi:hypothetical protein